MLLGVSRGCRNLVVMFVFDWFEIWVEVFEVFDGFGFKFLFSLFFFRLGFGREKEIKCWF